MHKKKQDKEQKYYGIHACLGIFENRPSDIIKLYIHESNLKTFGPLLKFCAKNKKAYKVVSNEDLEKVSSSVHHEGVCLVAKEPTAINFEECLQSLKNPNICLLYLDGVQNPHNIGSILRTCAHFGIPYILGTSLPTLSPSACRIAKGGAETVRLVQLENPLKALKALKNLGFSFIGTSSHNQVSLYASKLPARTIFAFGSEASGMSEEMMRLASTNMQIPGTGAVESLNVSIAASLCIGEYSRQHPIKPC